LSCRIRLAGQLVVLICDRHLCPEPSHTKS
jgi:hypothetical protein